MEVYLYMKGNTILKKHIHMGIPLGDGAIPETAKKETQ